MDALHPISAFVRLRDSSKVGNWQILLQFRLISYFLFLPHKQMITIHDLSDIRTKSLTRCANQAPVLRSISRETLQKLRIAVRDLGQDKLS